ncbi:MAG: LacI family DNA-binding transcriptional regulator [Thermoanaerobacteraceae bacterium]
MATIRDVALKAGVSVATVSRVINNSPSVSKHARENVLNAIKELNYYPNLLGRNLRRSKTSMILALMPNVSNPFYARIVKGIEDIGHKNGYSVMICNTESDINREKIYLELLKNRLADGVIFMAPVMNKDELTAIGESYPVVECCEYIEGAGVSYVSIDNFAAAYKAVKHLITLGHKRIGMISADNNFVSTIQREAGYKKAIEDAGNVFDEGLIKKGDYSFKSGLRISKQFLSLADRPTAIFAISDIMAIGAIRAIKEEGLKVPEDFAVVGFDDISFASMYDPMLTTISQPKYDLGCYAMELLLKQIKDGLKERENIILEHELIIRESTVK